MRSYTSRALRKAGTGLAERDEDGGEPAGAISSEQGRMAGWKVANVRDAAYPPRGGSSADRRDVETDGAEHALRLRVEPREFAGPQQDARGDEEDPAYGDHHAVVPLHAREGRRRVSEEQRGGEEGDRQAGGVDAEEERPAPRRVRRRGERQDRTERRADARRPRHREGGAGNDRAALAGPLHEAADMELAV